MPLRKFGEPSLPSVNGGFGIELIVQRTNSAEVILDLTHDVNVVQNGMILVVSTIDPSHVGLFGGTCGGANTATEILY